MLVLADYLRVLLGKLGIPFPDELSNEDVISLKIGYFTYNFKVHSEKFLVIYSLVDASDAINNACMKNILAMNHFSDEEHAPVFAYDNSTKQFLVWNRKSSNDINDENVIPQLEAMIATNEAIAAFIAQAEDVSSPMALDMTPRHIGILC
ncbi:CesT family type III secretion system chaperone [Aeromonas veronii]|uniref:CesT family type III secretion system chaperone n=1 Tax=Aeromonas veronii TaxID=654 RepID=UPI00366B23E2